MIEIRKGILTGDCWHLLAHRLFNLRSTICSWSTCGARPATYRLVCLAALTACAHTPSPPDEPSLRPLDPLSSRVPFELLIDDATARAHWEELQQLAVKHSQAFGVYQYYDPSWTLTACRSSLLEDLPYGNCLRISAAGGVTDTDVDPGAITILLCETKGGGMAQLRVVDMGAPWGQANGSDLDDARIARIYLGAIAILDTTVTIEGDVARRLIDAAASTCLARVPLAYPDERAVGPENWSLEVKSESGTCRGVERKALERHEIWEGLVSDCLAVFGHTVETVTPLLYRVRRSDEMPWIE